MRIPILRVFDPQAPNAQGSGFLMPRLHKETIKELNRQNYAWAKFQNFAKGSFLYKEYLKAGNYNKVAFDSALTLEKVTQLIQQYLKRKKTLTAIPTGESE